MSAATMAIVSATQSRTSQSRLTSGSACTSSIAAPKADQGDCNRQPVLPGKGCRRKDRERVERGKMFALSHGNSLGAWWTGMTAATKVNTSAEKNASCARRARTSERARLILMNVAGVTLRPLRGDCVERRKESI